MGYDVENFLQAINELGIELTMTEKMEIREQLIIAMQGGEILELTPQKPTPTA